MGLSNALGNQQRDFNTNGAGRVRPKKTEHPCQTSQDETGGPGVQPCRSEAIGLGEIRERQWRVQSKGMIRKLGRPS